MNKNGTGIWQRTTKDAVSTSPCEGWEVQKKETHEGDGDRSENGRSDSGVQVLVEVGGLRSVVALRQGRLQEIELRTHLEHLRGEHGESRGGKGHPQRQPSDSGVGRRGKVERTQFRRHFDRPCFQPERTQQQRGRRR